MQRVQGAAMAASQRDHAFWVIAGDVERSVVLCSVRLLRSRGRNVGSRDRLR